MTDKIGTVSGYAALFNEPSLNLASRGAPPCFEVISAGGLTLASNVMLDRHHWEFLEPVRRPVVELCSASLILWASGFRPICTRAAQVTMWRMHCEAVGHWQPVLR
jgi:hypothetical protein